MITKVVHGWRVGGLIAYLMGPGRAEEHRSPRVIASWDGRDAGWQPAASGPGEWDLELGPLIRALRAPVVAAGLPDRADEGGKRGYVWHCSARVARADRVLSDAEWAEVARELLHGAGIARRGDAGGPRWVAIRHADDHIHIAAVLVRQDTARRFWPHHDFPRLRQVAGEIERRLGLTITAAADGTAARAPKRGELEKASRLGREPVRVELGRVVRAAAVAAHDVGSFRAALRGAGYLVELRYAPSGDPLGYKVARPDDRTAAGFPVFYSGSRLAPDLSLPKLLHRWGSTGPAVEGGDVLGAARGQLQAARGRIAGRRVGEVEDVVHAVGDVVTAAQAVVGPVPAGAAGEVFARAARAPRGTPVVRTATGVALRRVARQLIRHRRLVGQDEVEAGIALAVALAALLGEVAAWQRARGRVHQAAAASAAADVVATWPAAWSSGTGPRDGARVPVPVAGRGHGSAQPRSRPRGPRPLPRPRE